MWARTRHNVLNATSVVTLESLLGDYRAEAGLLKNPPGMTVGGIRGSYYWEPDALPAAGSQDEFSVGILVAPDTVEAVDIDPSGASMQHLDWLWLDRRAWGNLSAAGTPFSHQVTVRAQRKMEELNEDLFLAFAPGMGTPRTLDITFQFSVLLILP